MGNGYRLNLQLNIYRMPREANVSCPIKWAQIVELDDKSDKEDMEMADLMHTCGRLHQPTAVPYGEDFQVHGQCGGKHR